MSAPRALIADDHHPTRTGVRAALEDGGFEVVADVADGPSAVAAALEHRPDVCVLDVHMPGSGIAAAAQITAKLPDTAVVMLTASAEDDDLFEAIRAGASGYLLKDIDPARLPAALEGVMSGEAALPRSLALRVMAEFRSRPARRGLLRRPELERLSERESEVLSLLAEGLSTDDVAARLFVGAPTVRSHVKSIVRKLQVANREAAIKLAREGGS
jgi:DNA-binding NarL/FixJ family response regulator